MGLRDLLVARPEATIESFMKTEVISAPVGASVPASGTRNRSIRPPASGPDSSAVVVKRNAPSAPPENRTGSSARRLSAAS